LGRFCAGFLDASEFFIKIKPRNTRYGIGINK
jgi:hypothetical protein